MLGGASRLHELRVALVELSALPLFVSAGLRLTRSGWPTESWLAPSLLSAITALPLLQLLPLPPAVWGALPGREQFVEALGHAAIAPSWGTLSLTPDRTWRSFLALLPPGAMLLGVMACRPEQRLLLVKFFIVAVMLSVIFGAAQVATGDTSLYLWATTDAGSLVGFMANRNHLATLCLMAIPFVAVMGAQAMRSGPRARTSVWLWGLGLVMLVIALGAIRSRAGVLLAFPVLGVSAIAAWFSAGRALPRKSVVAAAGVIGLAVLVVISLGLQPILQRFESSGAKEGRFENWPIVAEAAGVYLPVGTGIGSFDTVFRSVEPLARLDATFFNQAHNDYLEGWLESGWLAAGVLALFLVWYSRRTWAAWNGPRTRGRHLRRAASIAIGAVLAHSAFDYPLRTLTITVAFALCAALLEFAGQGSADDVSAPA